MKRGFSATAWTLLLLAVLTVTVTLPIGALQAPSAADFNRWVGWATVAAVPLAAGGLILMFWNKVTASVTRPAASHNGQDLLERQRLNHDQGQTAAGPKVIGRERSQAGDTLPLRNPAFTGRVRQLDDLGRLLAVGPVAVVAVRGLGGVGKSQLALEYAHRMRQSGRYQLAGWVRADSAVTVAEDLAALAPLLGLPAEAATGETAAKVVGALELRQDWLVVFDNAQTPDDLAGRMPRGGGHILLTSRNRLWSGIARQFDLDEFSRADSVRFVIDRSGCDELDAANDLAGELGDLPLALAQAAAYIDTRSMTIGGYLDSYRDPVLARRLRDVGLHAGEYPASVARTWLMSFSQLSSERPAAVDLLRLCAFLDSDDIDLDLLSTGRAEAGCVLARVLDDRERTETVGVLAARNLVTVPVQGHLRVHRLVQAVTRDQLDDAQAAEWAGRALRLIATIVPPEPTDYRSWPKYARLAPHMRAVTEHASSSPQLKSRIELLRKLGAYLSESEQPRAARIIFERVLTIHEAASGSDNPEVAKDLDNLGAVYLRLGELGPARANIERALNVLQQAYGPDNLDVAKALGNLSIIQRDQWELEKARASIERALAIFQAAYDPGHPVLTHAFVHLGIVQLRLGELADARFSLERALAMSRAAERPDHPEAARALISLGGVQLRQGELMGARVSLEQALAISTDVYGPDHPEVATALISLGAVQTRQGELENARASLARALAVLRRAYGPDHPDLASALVYLGAVQQGLGELRDARVSMERALGIREAVYGPDHHPWVATALINLAVIQLRLGELERASTSLQRAQAIGEAVYGPDHPEIAKALIGLGIVHLRMGRFTDSRASLRRAQAISEAAFGSDYRKVAQTVINLGVVRHETAAKYLLCICFVMMRTGRNLRRLLQ